MSLVLGSQFYIFYHISWDSYISSHFLEPLHITLYITGHCTKRQGPACMAHLSHALIRTCLDYYSFISFIQSLVAFVMITQVDSYYEFSTLFPLLQFFVPFHIIFQTFSVSNILYPCSSSPSTFLSSST